MVQGFAPSPHLKKVLDLIKGFDNRNWKLFLVLSLNRLSFNSGEFGKIVFAESFGF